MFTLAIALRIPLLLASVCAACVALTASFIANRRWTFRDHNGRRDKLAIRFVTIWISIVLLGLPVLAALVNIAHLPRVLAQGIVIACGAPISYIAQRRWTFTG